MEEKNNKEQQTVFKEEAAPTAQSSKTSMGMDENVASMCCYVLGAITGIIFLVMEKENKTVRFHAFQSIFVVVAFIVINVVVNVIPILGLLISILLAPVALILWIVLMMKAYQGKMLKLPFIGNIAENMLKS